MKTQDIRLFDVFILGPFMFWAGMQLKNDFAKTAMILAGAGTIVYNWKNFQEVKTNEQTQRQRITP